MDVFQELELEQEQEHGVPQNYVEDFLQDLNAMWKAGGIQMDPPQPMYAKPSQKEAAAIWDACRFPWKVSESQIESGLWEWSIESNALTEKDNEFYVSWSSNTTLYTAKWSAFFRWFVCTLGPPVA